MYSGLRELLSDRKGGRTFSCFGPWHIGYIVLFLSVAVLLLLWLKKRPDGVKGRAVRLWINLAFGLYITDFFLMPFAYGEIDLEKLPFHVCTAMCVMCFVTYNSTFLQKYRSSFVLLGLISNLVYLIYPAGVMWHQVHPLTYRVVQTLIFHGCMTVFGVLALAYDRKENKPFRDLAVLIAMTLWAVLGNFLYNGEADGYSHVFNWFFVVQDPFGMVPEQIAPYIMPLVNIVVFFAVELLVSKIISKVKQINQNGGKQNGI